MKRDVEVGANEVPELIDVMVLIEKLPHAALQKLSAEVNAGVFDLGEGATRWLEANGGNDD